MLASFIENMSALNCKPNSQNYLQQQDLSKSSERDSLNYRFSAVALSSDSIAQINVIHCSYVHQFYCIMCMS